SFVVAPVPAASGEPAVRVDDRYSVSVFPYVAGQAGRWGHPLAPPGHDELVTLLARLHRSSGGAGGRLACPDLDLPGRPAQGAALADVGRRWDGGPLAEPLRRVLAADGDLVLDALRAWDRLALRMAGSERELVLTHGEPHPGNLIRTADGLVLI